MKKIGLNEITKCTLLCVGFLMLLAIAGTIDYRDATHFYDSTIETVKTDTTETAYDVLMYCKQFDNLKK